MQRPLFLALMSVVLICIINDVPNTCAFTAPPLATTTKTVGIGTRWHDHPSHVIKSASSSSWSSSSWSSSSSLSLSSHSSPGDKIRESTGKRPSLNPTIINTLSEALSLRCSSNNDPHFPMEVSSTVKPLDVALAAGKLATQAIEKRAKSSNSVKGDESSAFTVEESQLIAGRVVGVVMRWNELETELIQRVKSSGWVIKYREEASFGVLLEECRSMGDDSGNGQINVEKDVCSVDEMVKRKLKDDPLLRMCRAECLYALFLKNVEMPAMEEMGQVPVDGGVGVDFLDKDRMSVLFPDR